LRDATGASDDSTSERWCLPFRAIDKNRDLVTDKAGKPVSESVKHGTYVGDANAVSERDLAFGALNNVGPSVKVPVDAVTSSGRVRSVTLCRTTPIFRPPMWPRPGFCKHCGDRLWRTRCHSRRSP